MSTRACVFAGSLALVVLLSGCGNSSSPKPADLAAVPPAADQPPALISVSPQSGEGASQVFTAVYSHPGGAKNVISAFLLVEKGVTGIGACFLEYNSATNSVNLMSDAGKWQSAVSAGTAGKLANTQCSVDPAGVRGSVDGNNLAVTFPLTFTKRYGGPKQVYISASAAKSAAPWVQKANWVVR